MWNLLPSNKPLESKMREKVLNEANIELQIALKQIDKDEVSGQDITSSKIKIRLRQPKAWDVPSRYPFIYLDRLIEIDR